MCVCDRITLQTVVRAPLRNGQTRGGSQIAAIKDSLLKNNVSILQNTSYRNILHHAECLVTLKWPYHVVYLDI